MNRVRLKICGLKRACDVALCHALGVDIGGFVVEYPLPVPWNLMREEARLLLAGVQPPMQSCVVTGGSREKILALAKDLRPDYVQLHAHEMLSDAAHIAQVLRPLGIGVIKTLPLSPDERLAQFSTKDVLACAELLNATEICAILVDARAPSNAAGPGTPVDVDFYRRVKRCAHKPVILAGGITPKNLPGLLSVVQPDIIDIMTGVEAAPGIKDEEKLGLVVKQAR